MGTLAAESLCTTGLSFACGVVGGDFVVGGGVVGGLAAVVVSRFAVLTSYFAWRAACIFASIKEDVAATRFIDEETTDVRQRRHALSITLARSGWLYSV